MAAAEKLSVQGEIDIELVAGLTQNWIFEK
jgi:hypothetical protein